jgi:protein-arginine kinase activator protein McsA
VDSDITNLKNQILKLEAEMEAAAEQEDYDKAE